LVTQKFGIRNPTENESSAIKKLKISTIDENITKVQNHKKNDNKLVEQKNNANNDTFLSHQKKETKKKKSQR
jgi:hypothetical protein